MSELKNIPGQERFLQDFMLHNNCLGKTARDLRKYTTIPMVKI